MQYANKLSSSWQFVFYLSCFLGLHKLIELILGELSATF